MFAPGVAAIPQSTGGKPRRTMEQDTPERKYADHSRCTAICNLLDYPSVVFQTGLIVDPALDPIDSNFSWAQEIHTTASNARSNMLVPAARQV